jgi:hypothetical protein
MVFQVTLLKKYLTIFKQNKMVFSHGLKVFCMNPKNDRIRFKYLNPVFKQHILKKIEHINKIERTILNKQMKCKPDICETNLKQLYDKKQMLEKEVFNLYFEEED